MKGKEFLDYILVQQYQNSPTYKIGKTNKQSHLKYSLKHTSVFNLTDMDSREVNQVIIKQSHMR
ncbi:hypothetical protein ACS53_01555 [Bacillus cereus]|nr:hypothetical protein ACS53_01555 [Bacillus cereus]